jgi:hypothetical protein
MERGVDKKRCVRLGLSDEDENATNAHITSMMKQHQFYPELEVYCQERETHEKETGATAEKLLKYFTFLPNISMFLALKRSTGSGKWMERQ